MRSTLFRRGAVAVSVLVVADLAWLLSGAGSNYAQAAVSNLFSVAAAAFATGACWYASRRSSDRAAGVWLLLAVGIGAWALGDAIWAWRELHDLRELFPSTADRIYLIGYLPLGIGLCLLPAQSRNSDEQLRLMLDSIITAGALLFLAWAVVLRRLSQTSEESGGAFALSVAYPLLDVMLISAAVIAVSRAGVRRYTSGVLVAIGLALIAVADGAFVYDGLNGTVASGQLLDIGWPAGYLLLALAALAPDRLTATAVAPDNASARPHLPYVPYLPLGIAIVTSLILAVTRGGLDSVETATGALVMTAIVVRQFLTFGDNTALESNMAASVEELKDREAHFRSLVQASSDVIAVGDAAGTLSWVSSSVEGVLGYDPDELIGRSLAQYVHPRDWPGVLAEMEAVLEVEGGSRMISTRVSDNNGEWRYCETAVSNELNNPSVRGLVLNVRDVSDRHRLEEQLTHQALHDTLTGLANRALLRDRLQHALDRRERTGQPLAVLVVDLDGFAAINDSLGHATGDDVLRTAAERLRESLRPADTLARLGGDEFAVMLDDIAGPYAAQDIADRFLSVLAEPFHLGELEVALAASIGLAVAGRADTADDLLRNADLAMFQAKARGRGRCETYQPEMHAAVVERLAVEGELRHAVERDELRLHYQPVINLTTGEVVGVEALLRWEHPVRGLLYPADFITLAEDSGLIVPIGRWVLREACRQLVRWEREDAVTLRMAVNLSIRQMQVPRLAESVAQTLRLTGCPAERLVLEITESVLVDDADRTMAKLQLLREIGVGLAIDDFGVGYSSLSYLRRLPITVMKVDRAFVSGLGVESDAGAVAATIINLGHELGLETVAEGVAEAVQLDALRSMGCLYGQGFHFSPGVPAEEIPAYVAAAAEAGAPVTAA